MTIISDLTKSMAEEREAARRYRARAVVADRLGLPSVARLYRHVAKEEDTHEREYRAMRTKVRGVLYLSPVDKR